MTFTFLSLLTNGESKNLDLNFSLYLFRIFWYLGSWIITLLSFTNLKINLQRILPNLTIEIPLDLVTQSINFFQSQNEQEALLFLHQNKQLKQLLIIWYKSLIYVLNWD